MSKIWMSITLWAVAAALVAVAACFVLMTLYPSVHPGILLITAFLGVQLVYLVRAYARRRGWAIATYAPQGK
jgi:hypothetical protein